MNLLVTGSFEWEKSELIYLSNLGHNVVFMQQEKDELPCPAEWVEGIIGNGIFLSHPIDKFTSLKYIQLTSAGFERVPMEYVKARGIAIHNARGVYSIPMAEFAICSVLELYKKKFFFFENQRAHKWIKHRDIQELYGKIVCIVGCGSVGTECAKRFSAFGCQVIGVDIKPYISEFYEKMVLLEKIDDVLRASDIVVLTLPFTEQTKHLMNTERLSKIKIGAVIVNIARGAIVDTEALTKLLENRQHSAILDVFEEEPIREDSPLWDMENVLITPHNSFLGNGNHDRMFNVIYQNLESVK